MLNFPSDKLLPLPNVTNDMTASVSSKGFTIMKERVFKSAYTGMSSVVQAYGNKFQNKEIKKYKSKSTIKKERKYTINKKVIKNRLSAYVLNMKGKKQLYFWTITFPKSTPDEVCLHLLNKWLLRMRRDGNLRDYLWVSERQENGTLHYHMAVNQRIDVVKANQWMRASIMTSIDEGDINWTREQAKKYNGVDIAKDNKTRRVVNFAKGNKKKALTNYITKYITKNSTEHKQLAWHNSRGYSNLIIRIWIRSTQVEEFIKQFIHKSKPDFENDNIIHYRFDDLPPPQIIRHLEYAQQLVYSHIGHIPAYEPINLN